MRNSRTTWISLALALVGAGLHFLMFELRYRWYVDPELSTFLSIGYVAFLVALSVVWMLYPSRIATAFVAIAGIIFPKILRSDEFVTPNVAFAIFAAVPVILLIAASHLRLQDWRIRKQSVAEQDRDLQVRSRPA